MIQPVILGGGGGLRLYPVSTRDTPKQFLSLGEKGTLLEETIRRVFSVMHECAKKDYAISEPLIVMNKTHSLPPELSEHEKNVIYESYANDTAVAVARAALEIQRRHGDSKVIMVMFPADHYIENVESFVSDIVEGIYHVTDDNIVLYGINPTSIETKYGYIIPSINGLWFREKPDAAMAMELIKQGGLWNAGIFSANVDTILRSIQDSPYHILDWIINPREGKAPSFDVAILQEYPRLYAHACSKWGFKDVGTYDSYMSLREVKEEMSLAPTVIIQGCHNVNVLNRDAGNVVVIGCKDIIVVRNGGDLLVMSTEGNYDSQLKEIAARINK